MTVMSKYKDLLKKCITILRNVLFATNTSSDKSDDLKNYINAPIKNGLVIIGIGTLFFLIWGSIAPLDSASIADGSVTVAEHRKTLQHLEGGIIESILVEDGQEVKEGDILMRLNDSHHKAQLKITSSQLNFATAVRARLAAELSEQETIAWDDEGFDFADPQVGQIIATQTNLFTLRRDELLANQAIINQRIEQNHKEIISATARKKSLISQQNLMQDELEGMQKLMSQGLALRTRILEIQRSLNETYASIAEAETKISAANQSIAENKLRLINIKNERQREIAKESKENHSQVLDLLERYNAAKDTLDRTVIKAPIHGEVTDLKHHTIGGVILPGHKILDIVPKNGTLIIEAKIKVQDIESIYPGLIAKVQLNAYKSRLVPRLDGKVIYVSADALSDGNPQIPPYYVARIKIDDEQIQKLNADIKLYPGMPATVFVVKGTRTFLQYLISPITDSFYRAFKEK